jgi:hypothetical protein
MSHFEDFTEAAVEALAPLGIDANFFSAFDRDWGRFDAYPISSDGRTYCIILDVGVDDLSVQEPIILLREGDADADVRPKEVPADIAAHADAFRQVLSSVAASFPAPGVAP